MIKILLILLSFSFLACSNSEDLKTKEEEKKTLAFAAKLAKNKYNICNRTDIIQAVILSQLLEKDVEISIKNKKANTENKKVMISCGNTTEKQLASITELNFQDKNLTSLTNKDFSDLKNLESLNLSDNKLTTLPEGLFYGLTNLNEINLSNNRLKHFSITIFNKFLPILKDTQTVLNNLPNLKSLDLRDNKLSETFKKGLKTEIKKDRNLFVLWMNGFKI